MATVDQSPASVELFYSYAHRDALLCEELRNHLTGLKRSGLIRDWYDHEIKAGSEWSVEIQQAMERAGIILLLVSADFVASKYINDVEVPFALQRHQSGHAKVIPVLLRPVEWQDLPYAKLQVLPSGARAVTSWANQDEAFKDVAGRLRELLYNQRSREVGAAKPSVAVTAVTQERVLDAAIASSVVVDEPTDIVTMVRTTESGGLKAILQVDRTYSPTSEDVQSKMFELDFSSDASGTILPATLELAIESPGFDPATQRKTIRVPPKGDSDVSVFMLTPKRAGRLRLNLQALSANVEIGSHMLVTTSVSATHAPPSLSYGVTSLPIKSSIEQANALAIEQKKFEEGEEAYREAKGTPDTAFSRDVLGRYICNTLNSDEVRVTSDPNARAAAGLPPRGDLRPFDFIIIGGGTFGSTLAEHLWFRTANRSERILVLEAGPFLLAEHVQNLPVLLLNAGSPRRDHLPQNEVWGLAWNSSDPIGFPGLAYCLGGRSVFWGGWSPRLLDSETPKMVWPEAVLNDLNAKILSDGRKGYLRQSSDRIGVTEANDFIFGDLHRAMRKQLFEGLSAITDAIDLASLPDHPAILYRDTPATADDVAQVLGIDKLPNLPLAIQTLLNEAKLEAPLAVQAQPASAGFFAFNKFSAVPLLIKAAWEASKESGGDNVKKRVMVVPRCHVIRLNTVSEAGVQRVSEVVTERGSIQVSPDSKVIIALGTVENARLALLSFGRDGKIGANLMAHMRSNLDFRVPRAALWGLPAAAGALETSALLVKGRHAFRKPDGSPDGFGHYQLQISASTSSEKWGYSETELFKKIPDIDTLDAHKNVTDTHIVINVRAIGEMESNNPVSNVTLDLDPQQNDEFQTRRAFVNLQASARDLELWDAMDKASDDVAKIFANGHKIDVIKNGTVIAMGVDVKSLSSILSFKPSDARGRGRRDGLGTTHDEAGTLRMGDDPNNSVTDANCRFHHVTNAYVAGSALFPTIGSANPMLTGMALVCRLGDHLIPEPPLAMPDAGFTYLFDGTDAQFANWQMAGGGFFSRFGRTIIARQDGKGIGLLFYTPQHFENFILRLDFLLPHPRGNHNDNSGVFVRFRDPRLPDPAPDPVDPPNNPAFVAVHTGFEIQIDEEGRGDKRFGEPDGLFFSRTGAIYKIESLGTGQDQQDYKNTQNLPAECWHSYEIHVNNQEYIVRLNSQEVTRFRRSTSDTVRGNPPSVDPNSGYIGVQTHTGNVAFANIRVKTL